jgi:DNA (cytosine-5)-methyltransferase 1
MKTLKAADLFCGAGGTSTGLMEAMDLLGHKTDLTAVNHWDTAVATHELNHPNARHYCASLDSLNPRHIFPKGIDILWASPECTHHSIARGGKPVSDQSRATAWCVTRWAEALEPNVILVENVKEFENWGPCGSNGKPLKSKRGATFRAWVETLRSLNYRVEWRILCAADFGDPTTRSRLFVQAVRGKRKIVWPNPTHSKDPSTDLLGTTKPWNTARSIIDFDLPSTSIWERKKPLAAKTLARILKGLNKYGLRDLVVEWDHQSGGNGARTTDMPLSTVVTKARHGVVEPYIVELINNCDAKPLDTPLSTVRTSGAHHALAEPFIVEMVNNATAKSIETPLTTVTTKDTHALCEPFIIPQQSKGEPRGMNEPAPTVSTAGAISLVEPFLVSYYGNGEPLSINKPLDTVTTKERFGLAQPILEIQGKKYRLDIKFRMLQPHELAAAQGFLPDYQFAGTKTQSVKQIGNAVPRRLARALALAAVGQNNQIHQYFN